MMARLFCLLGMHSIDFADLARRRQRAARQGVGSRKHQCDCVRCGRRLWL